MALHTRDDWDAAVETFNGAVIQAFQNTDQIGTDKMLFDSRPMGETVSYPVMENMAARNEDDGIDISQSAGYGRGTEPTTAPSADGPDDYYPGGGLSPPVDDASVLPASDVRNVRVEVDPVLKENRLIPRDQIQVRPELRLPENYALKLGRAVAEGKYIRCLALLAGSRDGALDEGLGDASPTADVIANGIRNAASKLDQAGVPNDDGGRHLFLHSPLWYSLLDAEGVITKEFGGQSNVQRPGEVIVYANIIIHNGRLGFGVDFGSDGWEDILVGPTTSTAQTTKYRTDMGAVLGILWHRETWALRHWENPSTDIDWVSLRNSFKVEARMIMGCEVIQDNGIVALTTA
jgi:hypothetical protein